MQGEASKIIRTIRQGLDMSQAEFAKALGWGTSTISRWESGKAEPNRLAMKIILAFGEERGIRYRPRTKALPAPAQSAPALPAVAVPLARSEEPIWTASVASERPAWEAHLNLRLAVDRGAGYGRGSRRSWFGRAAAGGAMCTALFFGIVMLTATPARDPGAKRTTPRRPATEAWTAAPATSAAEPVLPAREGSRRGRRVRRPPSPIMEAEAPVVAPAPPPPVLARLEGVTLLGTVRKATFRTDVDSITVVEGEQLGEHQAVRVGGDGVDLRDATGDVHTVKLGDAVAVR
jgi:transcriptional regulator with XRE-family HTH domain